MGGPVKRLAAYAILAATAFGGILRVEMIANEAKDNAEDLCAIADENRAVINEIIRLSEPPPGAMTSPEAQARRQAFVDFVERNFRMFHCEAP